MGIDYTCCEALLYSLQYTKSKTNLLTFGRQGIHIPMNMVNNFLDKYNFDCMEYNYDKNIFCENLLLHLGFGNIDSIDNSNYEDANIIHNLNLPISNNLKKYDYILDCGTIEHIFNTPQVCENIINLLNHDGIYLSVTPNNNFSGHGIYQFSPEFYLSAFSKEYGMEIKSLYLAKVGSGITDWIDVNNLNIEETFGRNISKFDGNEPVYIIAIIKKISNERKNLISDSPNQNSYENYEWNRK
jgi:hypothetical protein